MDNSLAKTNKAKGFQWLMKNISSDKWPENDASTLVIEDGNAIFHVLTNVPENFALIAEKIFDIKSQNQSVIFSTDMYKPDSVKSMERLRRGKSKQLLIASPRTKKSADWKQFLMNDGNKKRLVEILLEVWSSQTFAHKLGNRILTLICDGKATEIKTKEHKVMTTEIPELESNQEETDTRVILYCMYAKKNGYKNIVVRSPDSDIFFILLSYVHELSGVTIFFETGNKNKRKLINITSLGLNYSEQYCKALLGLHAFTGCDSTSAFKSKGKVRPIQLMLKDKLIINACSALGDSWILSNNILEGLERLTCRMYGMTKINTVNECRYTKLMSICTDDLNAIHAKKKFDTALIPLHMKLLWSMSKE